MRLHRSSWMNLALVGSLLLSSTPLHAATGDAVPTGSGSSPTGTTGSITIDQFGPEPGLTGEWSLIKPDHSQVQLHNEKYILPTAAIGAYTLIATPPEGASAVVTIVTNGQETYSKPLPQASFNVAEGDVITVTVTYTYTRTGTVSATSDPLGLLFTIKGPNDSFFEGATPMSFEGVAEGLYTIQFAPLEGCASPKPKSDRLLKNGRVNFTITIQCDNLDDLVQVQEYQNKIDFLTVLVDGEEVTFEDVPTSSWFSQYVATSIRTGILSGYRDGEGNATGVYGSSDAVTLAQLLKIAHNLAAIDETKSRDLPENVLARDTWFQQYMKSAEERDWVVFLDRRQDPSRPATRAEVIVTLQQALDLPRSWPKGEMFDDVRRTTKYSDSIETAAEAGLIAGYSDAEGNETGMFGPENSINRAEMAKVITKAIELYSIETPEIRNYKYDIEHPEQ